MKFELEWSLFLLFWEKTSARSESRSKSGKSFGNKFKKSKTKSGAANAKFKSGKKKATKPHVLKMTYILNSFMNGNQEQNKTNYLVKIEDKEAQST